MQHLRCFGVPDHCIGTRIGCNAVVIDVLRASSTICTALANGAVSVIPFLEVEQARQFKQGSSAGVVLGGERGGVRVDGFDLGNSPLEYGQDCIAGKTVAFTTTNGTRAMECCRDSTQVVIGAFCNLSAIAEFMQSVENLDIICAGTDGLESDEDRAFAGALIERIREHADPDLDDYASDCLQLWQRRKGNVTKILTESRGGRNLCRLGRQEDIEFCARIDRFSLVPRLNCTEWKIEPAWTTRRSVQ